MARKVFTFFGGGRKCGSTGHKPYNYNPSVHFLALTECFAASQKHKLTGSREIFGCRANVAAIYNPKITPKYPNHYSIINNRLLNNDHTSISSCNFCHTWFTLSELYKCIKPTIHNNHVGTIKK